MIRKKLRAAARKAALRAFKMEDDAKARETNSSEMDSTPYNPELIPRVVQGSGDTPGPNHGTLIGRTWVSAQLAGGVSPLLVDIRPPEEWSAGHLPGALLLPGHQVAEDPSPLGPETGRRVTIYDATGGPLAEEVAERLRKGGFVLARSLQGGWAEWVEHSEPVHSPQPVPEATHQLGDPVELVDGRRGRVQAITLVEGAPAYTVLLEGGAGRAERVQEEELRT
jgi:rhodanese-related sulfurtransferase